MSDLPRLEVMNPDFYKVFHPDGTISHFLTGVDRGDPHDHPFDITIQVIRGGYVEEVFNLDGKSKFVHRPQGAVFTLRASHIHRIVSQLNGRTETLCTYGPGWTPWSFYQWRDGRLAVRRHDQSEWVQTPR